MEVAFPLAFVKGNKAGTALFNFPRYYAGKGKIDNHNYEFHIQKGHFLSFRPEENETGMVVLTEDMLKKGMALEEDLVAPGRSFTLKNSLFKYEFLGIDLTHQILRVRKQGL